MKTRLKIIALITTPASLVCSASSAVEYHHSDEAVKKNLGEKQFSPYVGRNYLTRVLWGDQHLHTEISVDAGKSRISDQWFTQR